MRTQDFTIEGVHVVGRARWSGGTSPSEAEKNVKLVYNFLTFYFNDYRSRDGQYTLQTQHLKYYEYSKGVFEPLTLSGYASELESNFTHAVTIQAYAGASRSQAKDTGTV